MEALQVGRSIRKPLPRVGGGDGQKVFMLREIVRYMIMLDATPYSFRWFVVQLSSSLFLAGGLCGEALRRKLRKIKREAALINLFVKILKAS